MADATATPGTIACPITAQAPAVGVGAAPDAISLGVNIQIPSVSSDNGTDATAGVNTINVFVTYPVATIVSVDGVVSGVCEVNMSMEIDITAQLLGYQKYAVDGRPPEYEIVALSPSGTPLASLDEAVLGDISWSLSGAGSCTFQMGVWDPDISFLSVPDSEIQVWRGPDLLWQGVPVRVSGDSNVVTFQCVDLSWYFSKRVIGTAEVNYVPNNSFEEDLDQWIIQYNAYEPGYNRNGNYTAEVRTSAQTDPILPILGNKMLYMEADSTMYFGPTVASNGFLFEPQISSNEKGESWYLTAWVYVPSATWRQARMISDGVITFAAGIICQRFSTTETITVTGVSGVPDETYPRPIENIYLPLPNDIQKDQWIRVEVPFTQPITGQAEIIQIQCMAPDGGVYWDEISLVRKEALYFNNVDQALIVKGLVEHAQDTGLGKSDLRIGTQTPLTGVKRVREYEYFNHELISDTIDEWPALWDGVEWSIDITPSARTFRTHYPRKGATKPKYALTLGKNISHLNMSIDGEETANTVIVMADQGEGPSREEGVSSVPDSLNDNLTLEKVYNATPGSGINSLQAQARRGVRRYQNPVTLPDLVTYEGVGKELLGMLQVGDVVPVYVKWGWYDLNDVYRIVKIVLDPSTEQMTISINPEVDWSLTDG